MKAYYVHRFVAKSCDIAVGEPVKLKLLLQTWIKGAVKFAVEYGIYDF